MQNHVCYTILTTLRSARQEWQRWQATHQPYTDRFVSAYVFGRSNEKPFTVPWTFTAQYNTPVTQIVLLKKKRRKTHTQNYIVERAKEILYIRTQNSLYHFVRVLFALCRLFYPYNESPPQKWLWVRMLFLQCFFTFWKIKMYRWLMATKACWKEKKKMKKKRRNEEQRTEPQPLSRLILF